MLKIQKRRWGRRARDAREGQSLLEFAIVLPVLLLILLGILDLGRAWMSLVALNDAAGEGAAYAAIYPSRTEQIQARAAASTTALVTLEPDMVTVTAPDLSPGQSITVTISYPYELLTPLPNLTDLGLGSLRTINMRVVEVRSIIGY
jgi:Flp pilus assembly protein TadG